ncbi:hypothetical protein [Amycolatopsis thermoflava]|uniref:hypothetical protein n=1 Tax=Amycolatopsis thermoflava TaxID=84480 RepID=UPI0004116514|nr:hypothetical protein [Amycolatopsis thermoflava]
MMDSTGHDDNDLAERLLDDAMTAIAEEDDVIWPEADDLHILAGDIEEGASGV